MKHIHLDEFAKLNSPLHRMDPRAKAVAVFAFIFITVTLNKPQSLVIALAFWSLILSGSGIPLKYIFQRLSWIIPFAGFLIILFPFITPGQVVWTGKVGFIELAATDEGIERAVMLLLRVSASVMGLIFLMSTTRFNILIKALNDLKMPTVILQMVEFTIRYIFVTVDELKRMRRARSARGFITAKNIWHFNTITTIAQMVGTMFLRSYERGDRVYVAMLSRGFTGQIKTMVDFSITGRDYIVAGGILILAVVLLVFDRGGFA